MKLLKDRKGQIQIIEAFFASILILSTIALIPSPPPEANTTTDFLSLKGRNALISIDRDGYLSTLIIDRNWTTLRNCLVSFLSSDIWFNFTVFDENMNVINDVLINTGDRASEKIVSTEYLCTSISRDYAIYVVRLQLSSVT